MTQAHEVTLAAGLGRSLWALITSGALLALYTASALHSGVNPKFSESLGMALGVVVAVALFTFFPAAESFHDSAWHSVRKPWSTTAFGMGVWAAVFAIPAAPSVYTRSYPQWRVSSAIGTLLGVYLIYRGLLVTGRL